MTREQAVKAFTFIRRHVTYDVSVTPAEFIALCFARMPEDSNPSDPVAWVKAAMSLRIKCGRCAGTGMYVTMVENGQPKGPGGECFRCQGRGVQGWEDGRRNAYYDAHQTLRQ